MANSNNYDIFKEIEDIIDAQKRLGQYNVYHTNKTPTSKCVFSNNSSDRPQTVKFNEVSFMLSDQESLPGSSEIKYTDSEITIVKVKCNSDVFKKTLSTWDMNDIAIPGDGSHLGESPSLVNLATLVTQNVQCEGDDEYLVPISSWDPVTKEDDLPFGLKCCSDSKLYECNILKNTATDPNLYTKFISSDSSSQTDIKIEDLLNKYRVSSWAGKSSKIVRKHCQNLKDAESDRRQNQNKNKNE